MSFRGLIWSLRLHFLPCHQVIRVLFCILVTILLKECCVVVCVFETHSLWFDLARQSQLTYQNTFFSWRSKIAYCQPTIFDDDIGLTLGIRCLVRPISWFLLIAVKQEAFHCKVVQSNNQIRKITIITWRFYLDLKCMPDSQRIWLTEVISKNANKKNKIG